MHAILGASEACIATHPSDMCVALAALDATVQVTGANGKRAIPLVDFHRLPEDTPQTDTNLQPDELITAVELPALPCARHSRYRKCATAPAMLSRSSRSPPRSQSKTARSSRHAWRWAAWRTSPGALSPQKNSRRRASG